jgi:transposase
MAICDGHGLPLAVHVASASPGETTLVDATLAQRFLRALPTRLIGDRGYDSDPLDRHLADRFGIELISPNRANRRTRTQDGRPLRRYRRRWKIERLFAWFHNSRRIVTRWERHPDNFLGMIHLASAVILLRAFMR